MQKLKQRMLSKEYFYIYKITRFDGMYYIGMHSSVTEKDELYFGSGIHIKRSIATHGASKHNIEILEYLPDFESLKAREKEIVTSAVIADPLCMNIALGGGGGSYLKTGHVLCTRVSDSETVLVPRKEYHKNRALYSHRNEGRIQVIEKKTGIRKSIKRTDFDCDAVMHNRTNTVLARNLKTGECEIVPIEEFKNNPDLVGTNYGKSVSGNLIHIFDADDALRFICDKNFEKTCKEHNLPCATLARSYQRKGKRIFISKTPTIKEFLPYVGWYALKIS